MVCKTRGRMIYKIAIASDHAGFYYKEKIKIYLKKLGYKFKDFGTMANTPVDYPDYAHIIAKNISSRKFKIGILICGTGIGMSIVANKHKRVRAAVCESIESARYSRLHNNANILCVGARITSLVTVKKIIHEFLKSDFEYGRHTKRIKKIHSLTGL